LSGFSYFFSEQSFTILQHTRIALVVVVWAMPIFHRAIFSWLEHKIFNFERRQFIFRVDFCFFLRSVFASISYE